MHKSGVCVCADVFCICKNLDKQRYAVLCSIAVTFSGQDWMVVQNWTK